MKFYKFNIADNKYFESSFTFDLASWGLGGLFLYYDFDSFHIKYHLQLWLGPIQWSFNILHR